MDSNKDDMQQWTMDYEILNMKYVLGFVLFNSNQIYDTLQMLRMISTMYSRL